MSQTFWKFWAWVSIVCGLTAYFIGWWALLAKTIVWGVPTEFFFYDAIAAFMVSIFFLIYSVHYSKRQ